MNIVFTLNTVDEFENSIKDDFCQYLLKDIRDNILASVNMLKFQHKAVDILNTDIIQWNRKPANINMVYVLKLVVNNIVLIKGNKDDYMISINKKKLFPYSKTSLDVVVRYLDKGDLKDSPTLFVSNVFNKYTQEKIDDMWKEYIDFRVNM